MSPMTQSRKAVISFFVTTAGLAAVLFIYQSFLAPIFATAIVTFLAWPAVNYLDDRLRIGRGWIALILTTLVISILVFGVVRIVPILYREAIAIGNLAPFALDFVTRNIIPRIHEFLGELTFIGPGVASKLLEGMNAPARFGSQLTDTAVRFINASPSLLAHVVDVIIVPIATFFCLKDGRRVIALLKSLVPPDLAEKFGNVLSQIEVSLRLIVRGQVVIAFLDGILYVIGFLIIDLPSAVVIGMIAGACRLVPYLDVLIGGFLSLVVALTAFTSWWQIAGIVSVITAVQTIDGIFFTPRVFGGRLGIHPFVLLVIILGFGDWFGFWGILIAIPSAAVLKILVGVAVQSYRQSGLFTAPQESAQS